jgi:hypothetical protein
LEINNLLVIDRRITSELCVGQAGMWSGTMILTGAAGATFQIDPPANNPIPLAE